MGEHKATFSPGHYLCEDANGGDGTLFGADSVEDAAVAFGEYYENITGMHYADLYVIVQDHTGARFRVAVEAVLERRLRIKPGKKPELLTVPTVKVQNERKPNAETNSTDEPCATSGG